MACALKIGDLFEAYSKKHLILDIGAGTIKSQRIDDLVVVDYKLTMLLNEPTFGVLGNRGEPTTTIWDQSFDSLDDETREEVRESYKLIEPCVLLRTNINALLLKHPELVNKDEVKQINVTSLMKRQLSQLRESGCLVSERKLWRLWKKWVVAGFMGLANKQGDGVNLRKDNNHIKVIDPKTDEVLQIIPCRLGQEQVEVLQNVISGFYLKPLKPTKKEVLWRVEQECKRLNATPIPKSTVYRMLGQIEDRYLVLFRDGKKAYEQKYRQVDVRDNVALGPLHVVQIDHTLLDIDVLDDERTGVVGRPWITVGLDEYSRMPWCIEIGWEPSSTKVLARAIYHGILPKNAKQAYKTDNEWEVYGIPNIIYVDNGKEFHSKELQRIVEHELQSEIRYRPPKTPRYGGIVERFFGTLNTQLIHNLYGTRKSNPKELGERDPEKEACITLSELKAFIYKFMIDIYPYQDHKGLPKECPIPMAYYHQGLDKCGLPRIVTIAEKDNFWIRFLPEARRKICREGIRVNSICYSSQITKPLVGYSGQRVKVDPYDVSYIYLLHPKENKWEKIMASNPSAHSLEGLSEYAWEMVNKIRKEKGEKVKSSYPQTLQIIEARKKINDMVEKAKNKKRKTKRSSAIIKTTSKIKPQTSTREMALEKLEDVKLPEEIGTSTEFTGIEDIEVEQVNKKTSVTIFKEW